MRRLATTQADFDAQLAQLLRFEAAQDPQVDATVAAILADVKARGDAAVLEYTERFDGVSASTLAKLEIPRAELQAALKPKRAEIQPLIDAFSRAVSAPIR